MMFPDEIPVEFISYAAGILVNTGHGLSGSDIVQLTANYAVEYDVRIPHPVYPFKAPNKSTAFCENLMAFSGWQQFRIIKELCDRRSFSFAPSNDRKQLKLLLLKRYAHLAPESESSLINETLIKETKHWLNGYLEVLEPYNDALVKYEGRIFHRNLLDDLRLALEMLLRAVFGNKKSLENQIEFFGSYIKDRGGSTELVNMFVKLVDYYAKYQNTYVKHDDAVIEEEIEFIFEITSSFMKHLIRLNNVEQMNKIM